MRGWFARLIGRSENLGDAGERQAADFLARRGFKILARQHSSRIGEVDLVALDGDTIVFVEVKTRRSKGAGDPAEAVTPQKQGKLTRAALAFLKRNGMLERRARFDVVAVLSPDDGTSPVVTHYRDAFTPAQAGTGQMFA